jgi:hypothetical protein
MNKIIHQIMNKIFIHLIIQMFFLKVVDKNKALLLDKLFGTIFYCSLLDNLAFIVANKSCETIIVNVDLLIENI